MSLVPSLLQAIVHVDGEALVMHAGDKPYVVSPTGQVDLASRGLALDAVTGIVHQLLPAELQHALDEFGAVQYELPPVAEFPGEHFTIVAACGGDDLWVEIRRRRIPDEDQIPDEFFPTREEAAAAQPYPVYAAAASPHLQVPDEPLPAGEGLDFYGVEEPESTPVAEHPDEDLIPQISAALTAAPEPPPVVVAEPPAPAIEATAVAPPVLEVPPPIATPPVVEAMPPVVTPPPESIHVDWPAPLRTNIAATIAPLAPAPAPEPIVAPEPLISPEPFVARAQELDAPEPIVAPAPQIEAPEPVVAHEPYIEAPEPVVVHEPVAEAEPVAPEPVFQEPIAEPEPIFVPEPIAASEPIREPEPVASFEPIAAPAEPEVEPAPVAASEPIVAVEPIFAPDPIPAPEPVIAHEPAMAEPESTIPEPVAASPAPNVLEPEPWIPEPVAEAPAFAPPPTEAPDPEPPTTFAAASAPTLIEPPALWEYEEPIAAHMFEETESPVVEEPIAASVFEERVAAPALEEPIAAQLFEEPFAASTLEEPPAFEESIVTPTLEESNPSPELDEPIAARLVEAPQPAVVVPLSRNPIRAEQPPPAIDDPTMSGLDRLLRLSAARGASTLYLSSQSRPSVRVDGELQILEGEPVLTARDVESLLLTLMPERNHEALRTGAATEWILDIEDVGRVRCMSFRDHRGPGGVFRLMPTRSVSADQLGLPKVVQQLAIEPEGLVLVAGPRSSGKRTLMSAFVDLINRTHRDHVITIEREINIVHERGHSFISQREVRGNDDDMLAAARAALREDPDVLMIEDLRTAGLMNVALDAAASGHLVVGGFAAHSASAAVDRIIDLYPPETRRQVQLALADSLRGVIVQVLLRKKGGGRVAAREVLLNTPAVSSVIAEGKTSQISMAIEGGRRYGMIPLNDALAGLVQQGTVDGGEAYRYSSDRQGLLAALKRHGVDTSFVERLA